MKYTGIIVKFKEQPNYYKKGIPTILPLIEGQRVMTLKVDEGSVTISNKLVTITMNEDGSFSVEQNEKNK